MLAYGYTTTHPDPFDENSQLTAHILTDTGHTITGDQDHATTQPPTHPVSSLILRQLADNFAAHYTDQTRHHGEENVNALMICNLTDNHTPELIAGEFIQRTRAGEGNEATSEEFVHTTTLNKQLAPDLSPEPTVLTDHTPEISVQSHDPNYAIRNIHGTPDIRLLHKARTAHIPILLTGEPGTGKTTLCHAAFGKELITINCHETMTVPDLVGLWKPVPDQPGNFIWHDGPLIAAMQQGRPLLIDDLNWAPTAIQALLLPVLDHRRTITVIDRPDQTEITAADGFSIILTANPAVGVGITEPIQSRIPLTINIPTSLETAKNLGVHPDLLKVAYRLEDNARTASTKGGHGWVPSTRTLLETTKLLEIFGGDIATSAFLEACPIADAQYRTQLRALLETQLKPSLP